MILFTQLLMKKLLWKFYIENEIGTSSNDEIIIFQSWHTQYLDLYYQRAKMVQLNNPTNDLINKKSTTPNEFQTEYLVLEWLRQKYEWRNLFFII